MLPKKTFSLVVQGLKRIEKSWLEDRIENPHIAPYEIDIELKMLIERVMRDTHVHGSRSEKENMVQGCIEYLLKTGKIVGSPYGGTMFKLPENHAEIPTKEQLIESVNKRIDKVMK